MLLIVSFLMMLSFGDSRRCLPFHYVTNGAKCGDNTRVKGTYCGIGRCLLGTSCAGGCRQVTHLKGLKTGDVIMCTNSGKWKGGLALSETEVAYPVFDRGFNVAVSDLKTAALSYLGKHCRIETDLFDYYAHILGYAPQPNSTSPHKLQVFSYNWEYQVTMWKYGVAFSPVELVKFLGVFKE